MSDIALAIIGGSGLYDMPDLTDVEVREVSTPFGAPSDSLTIGTLSGQRVAFLPRHGRGHLLTPTEVPYRANIYALKELGAKYVVAVSACGSLREDYAPGDIVIPDQLFDHTKKRDMSFFGEGVVAHVGVADPFSPELSSALATAVAKAAGKVHEGGTFITIEGPRFSTKGESRTFQKWGMSLIGMTTSPEAYLAAEAEMAFACMAHVTDYDVWHESEEPVTVEQVIAVFKKNIGIAQVAIRHLAASMEDWAGDFPAHQALQHALLTDPKQLNPETITKLGPLVAKYWG